MDLYPVFGKSIEDDTDVVFHNEREIGWADREQHLIIFVDVGRMSVVELFIGVNNRSFGSWVYKGLNFQRDTFVL